MTFEEKLEKALEIALEDKAMSFHRRTKMKPADIAVDEGGQSVRGASQSTKGATMGATKGGQEKKGKRGSAHKEPYPND